MPKTIPTRCDRCGRLLKKGYRRLRMDRRAVDGNPNTIWKSDEFRRYYCPKCATELKKAVRSWEMDWEEL